MSERSHQSQVVNSMLWAAFGDALGFMSELVDRRGLEARTGRSSVVETVPWKYRVGGRYGAQVPMPAGAYSDDTQLRIATARSIGRAATFNVDAFSKVEIPVWLSYALGAGRGTKAAAANLSRDNVTWFANFYSTGSGERSVRYVESGGNGAAMRIQPHVWALPPDFDVSTLILSVVQNTVTTHGHPRALVGAVFYALVLADVLHRGQITPPSEWGRFLDLTKTLPSVIAKDHYLGLMWQPEWERLTGGPLQTAIYTVIDECRDDVAALSRLSGLAPEVAYNEYLTMIGGFNALTRGSGTKSAIGALALSWLFREDQAKGVLAAANALGSDTDTIGSMAGAILGMTASMEPPGELQDKKFLVDQALRLSQIASGADLPDFSYPSLLAWSPPRSASDSVGLFCGGLGIAGLGAVSPIDSETYHTAERQPSVWRWVHAWFGQTMLVKMRQDLPDFPESQMPQKDPPMRLHPSPSAIEQLSEVNTKGDVNTKGLRVQRDQEQPLFKDLRGIDLDRATQEAINSNFDESIIGAMLLRLAEGDLGIENSIAFAAIVAKARRARLRRRA